MSDFLSFKNVKDANTNPSSAMPSYQKSYHVENTELLYKCLRFNNGMVKSVLDHNGFSSTESHEWNILWSSGSCKSYLYEGLNEY